MYVSIFNFGYWCKRGELNINFDSVETKFEPPLTEKEAIKFQLCHYPFSILKNKKNKIKTLFHICWMWGGFFVFFCRVMVTSEDLSLNYILHSLGKFFSLGQKWKQSQLVNLWNEGEKKKKIYLFFFEAGNRPKTYFL